MAAPRSRSGCKAPPVGRPEHPVGAAPARSAVAGRRGRRLAAASWLLCGGLALGACQPRCAIRAEQATALELRAGPAFGDADVFIDGNYAGTLAAVIAQPLALGPGTHRLEVRKPGHFPLQRTVQVRRGGPEVTRVEVELLADPAT